MPYIRRNAALFGRRCSARQQRAVEMELWAESPKLPRRRVQIVDAWSPCATHHLMCYSVRVDSLAAVLYISESVGRRLGPAPQVGFHESRMEWWNFNRPYRTHHYRSAGGRQLASTASTEEAVTKRPFRNTRNCIIIYTIGATDRQALLCSIEQMSNSRFNLKTHVLTHKA